MSQISSPLGLDDFISEASVMLGDPFFKDFSKVIYEQGLLRSMRKIALEYQILDRTISLTVEETGELPIRALNFISEYRFVVNGITYEKTNGELFPGLKQYYIRYNVNQFVFQYSDMAAQDKVDIFYKSGVSGAEDFENDGILPVIPDYLTEELLKKLILYVASMGVVSFSGDKAERYSKALQIYSAGSKVNPDLHKNDQWIRIKPYQPL